MVKVVIDGGYLPYFQAYSAYIFQAQSHDVRQDGGPYDALTKMASLLEGEGDRFMVQRAIFMAHEGVRQDGGSYDMLVKMASQS